MAPQEDSEIAASDFGLGSTPADSLAAQLAASAAKGTAAIPEQALAVLEKQAAMLEQQTHVLRLQAQDLEREDAVRHWSLRVRHISDLMKLGFELAVAFIVIAIALGIAATVWSAAHDDSLVIEAFSVPPDMAARGLTGQAVAAQLQDKLLAMQAATDSGRPAASYSNSWGNDIKVEIPNTGISISEFYRYLATWLGKQTHIRGEVYRSTTGIVIAARAGGEGGTRVTGDEHDLDKLLQESAEAIYRQTQPYRYAVYLANPPSFKFGAARQIYEQLANEGTPLDRLWAQVGLGSLYDNVDPPRGPEFNRIATELSPTFALPWTNLSAEEGSFGHDEAALADEKIALRLLEAGDAELNERAARISLPNARANVEYVLGDFSASLRDYRECAALPDYSGIAEGARSSIPTVLGLLHQRAAARAALAEIPLPNGPPGNFFDPLARLQTYYWLGDWTETLSMGQRVEAITQDAPALPGFSDAFKHLFLVGQTWPYMALALAELGQFKAAHALIDRTPADCYTCMRNRADIDALQRNWSGASFWFARAVAAAPSIPIAYWDWGRVLMNRGDLDGAMTRFSAAHARGPRFADPLEMWGEALMLKNRSDLALAKFEEAGKYAPYWGRLHLKWGEALLYLGRVADAHAQFQAARGLDLSAEEHVRLAKDMASARH